MTYSDGAEDVKDAREIDLHAHKKIVVRIVILHGVKYIDIRHWKKWNEEDGFTPTKQGIMLPVFDFWGQVQAAIDSLKQDNYRPNESLLSVHNSVNFRKP